MYICRRALDQRLLFALPPAGPGPAPFAIFTHGSDVGRNQLRTWSFSTEAHWLRENGFAVLALMRRGRGRSEGINGEEDFGREHDGSLIDVSAGVAQAVEDLESAIAYGRKLPGVRPGPVLLAGQSRGGFLAMHYAGLNPRKVDHTANKYCLSHQMGCAPVSVRGWLVVPHKLAAAFQRLRERVLLPVSEPDHSRED